MGCLIERLFTKSHNIEMQKLFYVIIEKAIIRLGLILTPRKASMVDWQPKDLFILGLSIMAFGRLAYGDPVDADRARWAYPRAVIVTHDGGKLSTSESDSQSSPQISTALPKALNNSQSSPSTLQPSEKQAKGDSQSKKTLTQALHVAEKDLLECATDLRARKPDEVLKTPIIALRLVMPIAADGVVASVDYEGRPLPPYFVECASRSMAFLNSIHFPPRLDQRTIVAKVILETRFLRDEEAQGRGFQFYSAEEKWEKSLKDHPEWFRCKEDGDCVTSNEHCEIRSVNKIHLDAYVSAIRLRKKRYCPTPPDPAQSPSICRSAMCRVKRQKVRLK
jgi:hypothetical protein